MSIQQSDFSMDAEVDALCAVSKRIGGIATFLGCARDFSEGRDVFAINFEQYAGMAETAMNGILLKYIGAKEIYFSFGL